jgi:hypothetical protein
MKMKNKETVSFGKSSFFKRCESLGLSMDEEAV